VDLKVPYRFSGLSESVSWLSQFAGQGFEDVAALANLLLLQQFMLGEEAALVAATSIALTTPTNPTLAARTANSSEAGLTGVTTNVFVKVTACNYFGETTVQASGASVAATNGQVVDVQIVPVPGAQFYRIYTTTGASAGTYHLQADNVGGLNFTVGGAINTTAAVPPVADTGTSSTNRIEGLIPTLSGSSATGGSAIYPSGWKGGYINSSIGDTLNSSVLNTALQGMWSGVGAFRADPAELIAEGGDLMRLSNDVVKAGNNNNYRLTVSQGDLSGLRAGAAVAEFVNPITHTIVRNVVHPFLTQGTALLMTYQLPFAWSNVANAFEVNLVQDYISVSWPVIDATYRFSLYDYGALAANAPQYSGLLSGLQVSNRSGATGTWA
jgi:hypothetical protein